MVGGRLAITVEAGRVAATARRFGRLRWAAEAAFVDAGDLGAALSHLAAERPAWLRSAHVRLDRAVAPLRTIATIPRLRRADLRAHVQLHSRRYFLQNGIPLVTDALPLKGGGARLAAAPLPLVAAVCDGLAAAGLACTDIVSADEPALSLLPAPQRTARACDRRRALVRWAVAALAAVLLAVAARVASLVRTEVAAQAALARMRAALAGALAVRRDLDAATLALDILHGAGAPTSSAAFLATLAGALPDSAFLVTADLAVDGTVRLAGYAPRAAAVAAALERARLIQTPTFEGPVTRETVLGRTRERFTLRAVLSAPIAERSP